jgi:hypothetical protein
LKEKTSIAAFCLFALLLQSVSAYASSWNPGLLVNTETFQVIDDADTASDLYVRFGDALNKRLTFERTLDRFNFNDDVYVSGDLNVKGTASGKTVFATESLRSSGSLVWEGAASGASLWVSTFKGAGLTSCNADGETLGWNSSTNKFECGDDDGGAGSNYYAGQGLSLASSFFRLNASFSGTALEIIGTASGRTVFANDTLASSGNLIVESLIKQGSGAIVGLAAEYQTGAYLYASGASILALDTYTDQRNGGQSRAPHILFGYQGTFDTNLFRKAANVLMTDDSFRVGGTLSGASLWVNNIATSGAVLYSSGSQVRATARPGTGQVLIGQGAAPPVWKDSKVSMGWFIDGGLRVTATGGAVVTLPYSIQLGTGSLRANVAPTGAAVQINIYKNGTSIFSTKPSIAANTKTSNKSGTLSDTVLREGDLLWVSVDQVGSTVAGSGLTIQLTGLRRY